MWISVNDKLPEIPADIYGVSVIAYVVDLACSAGNHVTELSYMRDGGFGEIECLCGNLNTLTGKEDSFTPIEYYGDEVTHWQPLPEPPK